MFNSKVGHVSADIQRLQIKDLQEGHEYSVRIMAKNEVGLSDPLESEEPIKVIRPPGIVHSLIIWIYIINVLLNV